MPAPLLKAHQQLDRAVDRCYRPEPFPSDRHRVEYAPTESNARDGSHGTIHFDVFQQKT
jgi:hypothetical protein